MSIHEKKVFFSIATKYLTLAAPNPHFKNKQKQKL